MENFCAKCVTVADAKSAAAESIDAPSSLVLHVSSFFESDRGIVFLGICFSNMSASTTRRVSTEVTLLKKIAGTRNFARALFH